jgi:lysophospholipase L1-like esterase
LLAVLLAVIVACSSAIYFGASGVGDDAQVALRGPRTRHDAAAPASLGTWVSSWSAPPTGPEPHTEAVGSAGRTVRNVVHCSAGGTSARITLSNLYGQQPLTITHASLAVAAAPNTALAAVGTLRRLTFDGSPTVVIPAGQQTLSDAVRLTVPPDTDLLVSTYTPTPAGPITFHARAQQVSYAADGDHTEDPSDAAYTQQTRSWRYLTALDVLSEESDGTVVALGDSLTDGFRSTTGANDRWTDLLAARLRDEPGVPHYGVANAGISGNQLLLDGPGRPPTSVSALSRFQRDVLDRSGVKAVVIDIGINDILRNPQYADADKILEGLRELTRQAHARRLRVVGATLMPFGGHQGATSRLEAIRETINEQIRAGRVFDAVVDFDRAVRDPYNPHKLSPQYDSGDHLHPSDAGYRKMAETFDLSDLKGAATATL